MSLIYIVKRDHCSTTASSWWQMLLKRQCSWLMRINDVPRTPKSNHDLLRCSASVSDVVESCASDSMPSSPFSLRAFWPKVSAGLGNRKFEQTVRQLLYFLKRGAHSSSEEFPRKYSIPSWSVSHTGGLARRTPEIVLSEYHFRKQESYFLATYFSFSVHSE